MNTISIYNSILSSNTVVGHGTVSSPRETMCTTFEGSWASASRKHNRYNSYPIIPPKGHNFPLPGLKDYDSNFLTRTEKVSYIRTLTGA